MNESKEKLLKFKNELKKKNPEPRRIEKHRHPALPDNWRKPKGHHSKIRRGKKWELRMPKIGRRTPKALQNTDKFGRELIKINTIEDLKKLGENNIGILSKKMGLKKKLEIAKKSVGKYKFQNFNPEKIIEKAKEMLLKKKDKPKIKAQTEPVAKEATVIEKPKKEAAKKPKKAEAAKGGEQ
jgi:large subunit ribosomal protein L32e